ncbi:MAG TPA: histidine phosphatase family protein [Reyranella sp.]|nr:histidine phosphatase family protein [Reyranella sp.]
MLTHCLRLAGFISLLWVVPALGQSSATAAPAWIAALRDGGYVIVVRHGATYADQADTNPLDPKDTAHQRQLNDAGRAAAKSMGDALRTLKIPVGKVQTSQFQRAVETGTLLGCGEVSSTADIAEGGLVVTPNENNRRTAALRTLAATPPPAGTNIVLVTHKPNIVDAFGKDWFDVREGEASIFRPDGKGGYTLVARLQAAEWTRLAQAAP